MAKNDPLADKKIWLENLIADYVRQSPDNSLRESPGEKAWEEALVGFSGGADPLFQQYKEVVGSFHWTPQEIFELTFPGISVKPEELTVISWILPQREQTKADNRRETFYPAERWARARIFGEVFNVGLRKHLVQSLAQGGVAALAPMLSPLWAMKPSEPFTFASTWSERHAAHAAGLGTFGLCDGLITPKGKAVRVGSVIARIRIPPTTRPYQDHRAYCLFFSKGICGKCIKRCPVDALSESGHDKKKCIGHLHPTTDEYVQSRFGFKGYGCGLCQTGVPCESKIPGVKDLEGSLQKG
jgi:epoxyqueuosine reductase